jgi:hypothetical protein
MDLFNQDRISKGITSNSSLWGFGLGFIFTYLPGEFQKTIFERAEKNSEFAYCLDIC